VIIVDVFGENQIAVALGANATLTPTAVHSALDALGLSREDVVLASLKVASEAIREALATARSVGATTILNPAPALRFDHQLLGLTDILTPNRMEPGSLTATYIHVCQFGT
jgi:ribokinase